MDKRKSFKNALFCIINTIIVLFAVLIMVEISLNMTLPKEGYYVFPPNRSFVIKTTGVSLYDIDENPIPTSNSLGLRGPELPKPFSERDYIILFVGGSTTECAFLNNDNTWPALVAQYYNAFSSHRYNIIPENAGKAKHTTRNHVILLENLLPQIKPSCVIILCGGNDIGLILGKNYVSDYYRDPGMLEYIKIRTFWNIEVRNNSAVPFYKKLTLWKFARKIKAEYESYSVLRDSLLQSGNYIKNRRDERAKALKINNVFSDHAFALRLESGLSEYRRNIRQIINICRLNDTRVIFMTQPAIYKEDLPEGSKELLWLGRADFFRKNGEMAYISERDAASLLNIYNDTLKEVCLVNNVECIDLTGIINKDFNNFYDEGHFNKTGARKVGETVALYLRENL